jgi:LMBR1 domain-containing protein 1
LAEEARGEGQSWIVKTWFKIEVIFRPVKLLGGILLLLVSILTWVSMLVTSIDKAKNSICKQHCGYILANINIFNPINWLFVKAAEVFPVDYILFTLLVLLFFSSSVAGITIVGIRFLWIRIFQIRKGHTQPRAFLIATMMLAIIILALNYSISMIVAPQYATYGPQTFCDRPPKHPGEQPDCTEHRNLIRPCSELVDNTASRNVCTPTVASIFLNRVTINFPFFGIIDFWAQFVFLGKSSADPPMKNG